MKILAIETDVEGVGLEKITPYLKEEALILWGLYKQGYVTDLYFTKQGHNAVLMLECLDENHAFELLNYLPLVKEKLIAFKLMPLEPYDGFERLFINKTES